MVRQFSIDSREGTEGINDIFLDDTLLKSSSRVEKDLIAAMHSSRMGTPDKSITV